MPNSRFYRILPSFTEFCGAAGKDRTFQWPVPRTDPLTLFFLRYGFVERERERDGAANKNGDKLINRPSNGRSRPPASANQWNMAFEDTLSVSFLVLPEVGPSCNEFAK